MTTNSTFHDYFRLLQVVDNICECENQFFQWVMVKNDQIWEFDYAKSDRQMFLSVFKENNAIFDSDLQFFGLDPPSY